jgi:hypothetical protein
MGLNQTKELLHSKGNSHQTQETAHRMGENLCHLLIWIGIDIQNLHGIKKKKTQRINSPIKKGTHELNREFSQEELQMASKYMKKCLTFLDIKETQIKTTLRFYFTPVTMAIMNGYNKNKCWWGCSKTGTFIHCW